MQPSYAFLKRYVSSLTQAEKVSISREGLVHRSDVSAKARRSNPGSSTRTGLFWEILEFDFLEGRPYTSTGGRGRPNGWP